MTVESLKNIKTLDGFPLNHMETFIPKEVWDEVKTFVNINYEDNTISFKFQKGDPAEVSGCRVETLICAAREILVQLNKEVPSKENEFAVNKLQMALNHLYERSRDRKRRGVEGTTNA